MLKYGIKQQTMFLYFKPFLIAFFSSLVLTGAFIKFGNKYKLYDKLKKNKIHRRDIARFGGVAMIISFLVAIFLDGNLQFDNLKWGIVISSLVILFFGIYDDLKNLSWKKQLLGQIIVVLIMICAGLSVDYIANPFGGAEFRLDQFHYSLFTIHYSLLGSLFILFWIVGFMNIMNWLDGLDGLAGGVGLIGAVTLFFLSVSSLVNQPPLGIVSIIFAGAILGFLFFNFYPAKIFMGTSGSMFLGFMLAVIAIFSGGKIATALLIMGFPILDAVWVIARRIKNKKSPFRGDKLHLHYRLLDLGWSQKKVVLFIYFICLIFGVSALAFQTAGKVLALAVLFILMAVVVFWLELRGEKK
ncbi:MAG: MraY family glycosyltransferase [Patescibacteria group bacterium]|nr:MraY family glycosyltransferase [Patescibacteria group bacterium]